MGTAGQFADGLHLLRLNQGRSRFFQKAVRLPALGDVPRDLGKVHNRTVVATYRIDDDLRPEVRTVFSDAPSLGVEAPIARRRFQSALRQPGSDILGRVKARKMRADDFLRRVAP